MFALNHENTRKLHIPMISGVLSLFGYIYLSINSQAYGQLSLWQFYLVMTSCAIISAVLWLYYQQRNEEPSLWLLVGFAIVFRIVGVFAFPVLEDDFYRYLWDGRTVIEYGSPYELAPSHFFSSLSISDRFDDILGLINYPDIPTIYGPVNQWVFALAYIIAPGEIWPLQVFYALVDLLIIIVLLKLARPNMVLLYAWSPLIIKEFAFTAHPDVLGALLLLIAFVLYRKASYSTAAIALALAAGVKIFALLLVPFFLGAQWRAWIVFGTSIILIGAPWGVLETWLPHGLSAMGSAWVFNAPLYLLFEPILSFVNIKIILLSIMFISCLLYYLYCMKHWPKHEIRGDYLFMLLLICSPVLNPWYLVWLLPFATIYPSVWAWVASVSILLSYSSGINLNHSELTGYDIEPWIITIEFLSIVLIPSLLSYKTSYPEFRLNRKI